MDVVKQAVADAVFDDLPFALRHLSGGGNGIIRLEILDAPLDARLWRQVRIVGRDGVRYFEVRVKEVI